jgi:hypothetical protein
MRRHLVVHGDYSFLLPPLHGQLRASIQHPDHDEDPDDAEND